MIKLHSTLNPLLWKNNRLKNNIYNKLMQSVQLFIESINLDIEIVDIVITGSNCNYNYNEYSDIDVHIVVDYNTQEIEKSILQDYFYMKKQLFNKNHNIFILDIPIEFYVEDSTERAKANGCFSLLYDKWVSFPTKDVEEYDDVSNDPLHNELKTMSLNAIENDNIELAKDLYNRIYTIRSYGLENGGEFSKENLIFKLLRNEEIIEQLRDFIGKTEDNMLSLYNNEEDELSDFE